MTAKEQMIAGLPFDTHDETLAQERAYAARILQKLNAITMEDEQYRTLLNQLLPNASAQCMIRPPFFCDYGYNLYIGEGGFINYNCVMLDGAPIRIGNHVLIGPTVQIYTFHHPLDYRERRTIEICKPVTIGDDCWIGGGAILLPGVTIGPRSVVGAGSVVTKDIPADSIYVGIRHALYPTTPNKGLKRIKNSPIAASSNQYNGAISPEKRVAASLIGGSSQHLSIGHKPLYDEPTPIL